MAPSSVDAALVAAAAAANEAAREAKRERARAMDAMVDLLLERAEARMLLRETMPYLPRQLRARVREAMNVPLQVGPG